MESEKTLTNVGARASSRVVQVRNERNDSGLWEMLLRLLRRNIVRFRAYSAVAGLFAFGVYQFVTKGSRRHSLVDR